MGTRNHYSGESLEDTRARFISHVEIVGECWHWQGHRRQHGYGQFSFGGHRYRANRAAYMLFVGPIGSSLFVLHECDNPACVNPDHLFPGTHKDNMRDMVLKGRSARGARNAMHIHPESRPHVRGEAQGRAKLTEEQVRAIRKHIHDVVLNKSALAREFGVSDRTVRHVLAGETWQHVPPDTTEA